MKYKGYIGTAEFSEADGCFHGKLAHIRDLVSYEAESAKELAGAFHTAVDEYLADCEELGKKPDTPFKGSLNVRLGPDLHRGAAQEANRAGVKLNEFVKQAVQEKIEADSMVSGVK